MGHEGGFFYVCGSVDVRDVHERLKDVLGPDLWERVLGKILAEAFRRCPPPIRKPYRHGSIVIGHARGISGRFAG